MKRISRLLALILVCALTLTVPAFAAGTPAASDEMRGVWVSTVYNLDYPSQATTDPAALRAEADAILDNCVQWGLNAVFLQVRPSADSLYPSEVFPWSKYLTGTAGTAPADGFDPLAYWGEAAHARGLELHAWINPYRITRGGDTEWNQLPSSHPAKMNPDWVVKYSDGNYYFNPGLQQVRDLVTRGAVEIAQNYDVDGLHMDDYFYPGSDFADSATYQQYGGSFSNIGDWRRDNVNQLVAQLDTALHNVRPDIQFGISPSGIWANKSTDSRGSDTNGYEHYASSYADSLYWIDNGLVDYIIPQIYWEIGHKSADFATLADWWNNAVQGTGVRLYIGMAAYRLSDSPSGVWTNMDTLFDSLEYLEREPNVGGCVFFRYGSIPAVSGLADRLATWYQSVHNSNTVTPPATPGGTTSGGIRGDSFSGILSQFLLSMIR